MNVIGIDIGGTKCAVSRLTEDGRVVELERFQTQGRELTLQTLVERVAAIGPGRNPHFGISCGGPLDAERGVVLAPPNLPDWHEVRINALLTEKFGGRAVLMNDANASALAEWRFGAGRGCRHMIFLTAGTGMGAGLILNGCLYEGAGGDAGEVGHIRLSPTGPVGYGKNGSFEGYCSGGGIARLIGWLVREGRIPSAPWLDEGRLTAHRIALAAAEGDSTALLTLQEAGRRLGQGLAILVDILNPERIVIGGIFPRCREFLWPSLWASLEEEGLPRSVAGCRIVPAELGETIGSHGAIAAALHAFRGDLPQLTSPLCDAC